MELGLSSRLSTGDRLYGVDGRSMCRLRSRRKVDLIDCSSIAHLLRRTELVLSPVPDASDDVAPKLSLGIVDWTKSLGANIADSGITITSSRTCVLGFSLID